MVKNNYSVLINNKYVEVSNIYAVGRNYIDHAKEMKSEVREVGEFFNNITTQLHMPRQNTKLCRNGGSSGCDPTPAP